MFMCGRYVGVCYAYEYIVCGYFVLVCEVTFKCDIVGAGDGL